MAHKYKVGNNVVITQNSSVHMFGVGTVVTIQQCLVNTHGMIPDKLFYRCLGLDLDGHYWTWDVYEEDITPEVIMNKGGKPYKLIQEDIVNNLNA